MQLISKLEHQIILELLKKRKPAAREIAARFKMDISTLNSLVYGLMTYKIIHKDENEAFHAKLDELIIASEKEVNSQRRLEPKLEIVNPLPLFVGEELERLKEFVKNHCEKDISRSEILDRLKRNGYKLSRLELLQFIEFFKLIPTRKKKTDNKAVVA